MFWNWKRFTGSRFSYLGLVTCLVWFENRQVQVLCFQPRWSNRHQIYPTTWDDLNIEQIWKTMVFRLWTSDSAGHWSAREEEKWEESYNDHILPLGQNAEREGTQVKPDHHSEFRRSSWRSRCLEFTGQRKRTRQRDLWKLQRALLVHQLSTDQHIHVRKLSESR